MKRLEFIKVLATSVASIFAIDKIVGKESDADRLERLVNSGQPVRHDEFVLDRQVVFTKRPDISYCKIKLAPGNYQLNVKSVSEYFDNSFKSYSVTHNFFS